MSRMGPDFFENSEIYFSSPTIRAKRLYYNVLSVGHFYCGKGYHIKRDKFDSVLIAHIIEGTFTFKNKNGDFITAKKNDTVIVDCYEPHEYFTENKLEFIWAHIYGANCLDICREIINTDGNISKSGKYSYIKDLICKIFNGVKSSVPATEHELSAIVYDLLIELLNPTSVKDKPLHEENIAKAKEYISKHLGEKITVEILARAANMSITNFSRVFRQQTGFSPYDFVLSARLNKAKEYLLKTDMSVTEIAYETGFNSEANFIYCFTNNEGISPGKFRKIKF